MCGIVGFNSEDKNLLRKMARLISHRGPDDEALFSADGISLGMRRLSIIDLKKGLYPISNEDRTLFLVFNGEIYNYKELRLGLEAKGHRFATESDSEVIVHLYEEHGIACLGFLNGMFAIALWDSKKKRLFLARDRLGIKPLYYWCGGRNLAFSSEIKSLLFFPGVKRQVNIRALNDYLTFRCNSMGETMFKGIFKLLPGHLIVYDGRKEGKNALSIERYWDFRMTSRYKDGGRTAQGLYKRLVDSVKIQLMSDVPLGAYLSGGVDSGAIVGIMSRLSSEPVKTFSVAFSDDMGTELSNARFVAEHYRTDHHELHVEVNSIITLPKVVWHLDEPLCDPTCIPVYLMSERTKRYATVVLTGDGSDEQFAGYEQFRFMMMHHRYFRHIPGTLRSVMPPFAGLIPKTALDKMFKYASSLGTEGMRRFSEYFITADDAKRYLSLVSIFNQGEKALLYTDEASRSAGTHEQLSAIRSYFTRKGDYLGKVMRLDLDRILAENMLMKTDKMCMAFGIEARVPYLDHSLWEYSMSIDSRLKLRGRTDKYILRKALANRIPERVAERKKDRFFVPIDKWLSGELGEAARQLLSPDELTRQGFFRPEYVDKIFKGFKDSRLFYSRQLWALVCFQLWHRNYIEGDFSRPMKGVGV